MKRNSIPVLDPSDKGRECILRVGHSAHCIMGSAHTGLGTRRNVGNRPSETCDRMPPIEKQLLFSPVAKTKWRWQDWIGTEGYHRQVWVQMASQSFVRLGIH